MACTQVLRCYTPGPTAPGPDGAPDGDGLTLADVLAGIGGGGGFALPELPQAAVGLAPAERAVIPPLAILLLLAALAVGGYYLLRRKKGGAS